MESEYETTGDRRVKKIAGKEYWTSAQAAEYLGVCKNTLLVYCRMGLSHLKMGNNVLFQPEWLDSYIKQRSKIQTYKGVK